MAKKSRIPLMLLASIMALSITAASARTFSVGDVGTDHDHSTNLPRKLLSNGRRYRLFKNGKPTVIDDASTTAATTTKELRGHKSKQRASDDDSEDDNNEKGESLLEAQEISKENTSPAPELPGGIVAMDDGKERARDSPDKNRDSEVLVARKWQRWRSREEG